MKNLTERLDQHLHSIREESISRDIELKISKLDIQKILGGKLYEVIEKPIYNILLKPLEKGIYLTEYINYIKSLNKNNMREIVKGFISADLEEIEDQKQGGFKILD